MNTLKHKRATEDLLKEGIASGEISEQELAQWLVRAFDNDTDRLVRLIQNLREEQMEWIHDWFDELETGDKHKEMIKLDTASNVGHEHYRLTR